MHVDEALRARRTCRAFLPDAVPIPTLVEIVSLARRAPSGGNLQPWRVWIVADQALEDLKAVIRGKLATGVYSDGPTEYEIFPAPLFEPYDQRRFDNGEVVYSAAGIGHDDFAGRTRQALGNYELFGAPAAYFLAIDRRMGSAQWADLGMFLQSLMLAATARGLQTAPLESWAMWYDTVARFVSMPSDLMLFCAVAVGHADPAAPINHAKVGRAPLGELAVLMTGREQDQALITALDDPEIRAALT